jgi:hypothetical protein
MMNKILKSIAVFLILTVVSAPAFAKPRWWNCTGVIGGTEGTLDSIDGQDLFDGYKAIVETTNNVYFFTLDVDSGAAEDTQNYTVISPDTNAGDKRWILKATAHDTAGAVLANDATPSVKRETVFTTGGTTTITDFDDGVTGQIITILVAHSLTFDTTTAQDANHNLDGSSANITADAGDVLVWLCEDGTTWHLVSNLDASVDNN